MKIIIAPDSFKGSISGKDAAISIGKGIRRVFEDAEVIHVPMGDGGEGTMANIIAATDGKMIDVKVTGPLGEEVVAQYGILGDQRTCIIEMARASGIDLVPTESLNPLKATTYGTGELIKQALNDGFRHFILAIGGSATNDAGAGMLQALGARLLDSQGREIEYGGGALGNIQTIDLSNFDPRIRESDFMIASDVENLLIGETGATRIFGPQKGATPKMVERLEANITHFANLIEKVTGISIHKVKGAGAAGGMGGAFQAFFPTKMRRGIDVVIEYTKLETKIKDADLVFTGEGQIDHQTAYGKTPMGVAQIAFRHKVPTIILAGAVGEGIEHLYSHGVIGIYSIVNKPMSLEEAMESASLLLEKSAEQACRTYFGRYLFNT